jgi:two-component system chemotaxis response regulator CheB
VTVVPPPAPAEHGGARPLTIVIVDDSAVQRRFARAAIEADDDLRVVGEARNGRDAVELVHRLRPSAVLMDLHLPVMNGIEAIERIMATLPTPILVCSAFVDGDDRDNAAAALAAGAVDVMEKPGSNRPARDHGDGPDHGAGLDAYADLLRRRLRMAGRVKVITHPRARLGGPVGTMSTRGLSTRGLSTRGPSTSGLSTRGLDGAPRPAGGVATSSPAGSLDGLRPRPVDVIAIGASTGGPQALALVLADLPANLEAAVVVVQHMADGFIEGLAGWLDGLCAMPVRVGALGRCLVPGTVTIAPSGANLVVHGRLRVTIEEPPTSQHHVPGIDVTLRSVADAVGPAAVGVLLTGMGRDGADGLKRMRDSGAFTIAQDEDSSAVYGMPAAAVALDAVDLQLPLTDVSAALLRLTGAPTPEAPSTGAES